MSSSSSSSSPDRRESPATKGGVTVAEVEKSSPESQQTKGGSAIWDILQGALFPCIPVIVVSAALLTLILRHRVHLEPGWQSLQAPVNDNVWDDNLHDWLLSSTSAGDKSAYFIRYNPATLAAIASWTSKIIPLITGASMGVIAFFASRRILDTTKDDRLDQLPTPHQTAILVNLLQGHTPKSLFDVIVYRWQHHDRLFQPLPLVFWSLGSILFVTLLLGVVDTWFAVSVKPINVPLLQTHNTSSYTFGRDFDPKMCAFITFAQHACPGNASASCGYPCSIDIWNYTHSGTTWMKQGIRGASQAAEALLGNSEYNQVQNHTSKDSQDFFYLGDVASGDRLDFLANTTSVTTQCRVMTQECDINPDGPGFSCPGYSSPSFTYPGQVGVDPEMAMATSNMSMTGIQFFTDIDHQDPIGLGNQTTDLFGLQNPMYFMTWSKGFPPVDTSSDLFSNMTNGGYLQLVNGDNVFILNCTSTIYRTVYAWVNGTILQGQQQDQGFYTSLAPPAYGAIFSAPFAIDSAVGHLALQGAAALAAYKTRPQDVAVKFANEFSKAAVALTAGIMTRTPNMMEQSRNNTELLTRVPKVPLYFMIGLQACYALASILVALLAWLLTRPAAASQVKSRLTVEGLAAGLFEAGPTQERAVNNVEEFYSEHNRTKKREGVVTQTNKVGIRQTEAGGWVWVANGRAQPQRTNADAGGALEPVMGNKEDSKDLSAVEKSVKI
ncbi:MAG: hypothetical protein Q9220_006287 [cf. Caloplaca sp. 1 TL-2023]